MDWILNPEIWIALATLTVLEIVLGIDNIIFISILAGKLPAHQQNKARVTGLGLAVLTRILLLISLSWLMGLTTPLFSVFHQDISGHDLILIAGGLFLLGKSALEIHEQLEGEEGHASAKVRAAFASVIVQILLLDIVFSLDSIITAIGMTARIGIMAAAVIISVIFMIQFSGPISQIINRHPTLKMLALSFLLLIGVALIGEGLDLHIPKGYLYFAMAFSVLVEMLNLKIRRRQGVPLRLRQPYSDQPDRAEENRTV